MVKLPTGSHRRRHHLRPDVLLPLSSTDNRAARANPAATQPSRSIAPLTMTTAPFAIIGASKLQISADSEALGWFCRSIEANRTYPLVHFLLGAALALLGSLDHARAAAKAGLRLVPSFTIRIYRDGAYTDNPTYLAQRERIYEGMRLAGVPEE
ncbi:hypothetical protein [Bradyrhizobium sp. 31Argb]|uniref:hypothetical protein n=1 Tax=Bradyrhizobium sp. 31Argb TaxID=3141247 RepID=UPI0037489285